jgi:hypothetical protein
MMANMKTTVSFGRLTGALLQQGQAQTRPEIRKRRTILRRGAKSTPAKTLILPAFSARIEAAGEIPDMAAAKAARSHI